MRACSAASSGESLINTAIPGADGLLHVQLPGVLQGRAIGLGGTLTLGAGLFSKVGEPRQDVLAVRG